MGEFMGVVKRGKRQKLSDALFEVTGLMRYRDDRSRVSHLFPGGRSEEMLKKAVRMRIDPEQDNDQVQVALDPDSIGAAVLIENLTGHSIPNG